MKALNLNWFCLSKIIYIDLMVTICSLGVYKCHNRNGILLGNFNYYLRYWIETR